MSYSKEDSLLPKTIFLKPKQLPKQPEKQPVKKNQSHLPEEKQNELKEIVSYVTENLAVDMIILFGSYARGGWVEDKYVENGTTYEYKSDFDLLFVIEHEDKAFRGKIPNRLSLINKNINIKTAVNPISHGIDYLNKQLEEGSYFFCDIIKDGVLLYDNERFKINKPKKVKFDVRVEKAKGYYKEWLESADDFYLGYEDFFNREKYKVAIFNLHQAAERYYITILLVFTDYKPKTHDLESLDADVYRLDAKIKNVFPRETEEEQDLFKLLKKAYIDSRYKNDYVIEKEDLEYLAERVKLLRDMTEEVCLEKLKAFDEELELRKSGRY